MAPQLEAAKQQQKPAASSNGPASRTRAAVPRQQLAAAETVWPLLLQHNSIRTQLPVVCKLLCCSKSTAAAVADHSAGQLDIPRVQRATAAAIAAWLCKHAALARSVYLGDVYYDDAAIRATVSAALVAAPPQTLKLQSLKVAHSVNAHYALPLLEQLPISFMTHLDFGALAVQPDLPAFAGRVSAALGRLTALRSLCLRWLGIDLQSQHGLPGLAALTQLTALDFHGPLSDLQHVPHQQLLQLDIIVHQQPLDLQHMAAVTALTSFRLDEGDALPPNLLQLRVDYCRSAQPLLPLQRLQQLQLTFHGSADITADQLRQLSRLTALSLGYYYTGSGGTEPASTAAWHKLPLLQQLELANVNLSAPVCQHLAQLSGTLTSLQLEVFTLQADSATQLAAALRQLSGLQQLRLSDARWAAADAATVGDVKTQEQQRAAGMQQLLQAIGSLAQLRALHLRGASELAAAAAAAASDSLTALTSLTALHLAQCDLTDAAVAAIVPQLPGLQRLDCDSNRQLTDAALHVIGQLQQLQELSLGHTGVTDAGLQQLCGLVQLKKLDVAYTGVTEAGLCHLTGLSQLQE